MILTLVYLVQIFITDDHKILDTFVIFVYVKNCIRAFLGLLWASYAKIQLNHFGFCIKETDLPVYYDDEPLLIFIKFFWYCMENILNTIKVVLNEIAVEILNPEIAQYFPVVLDTFCIIAALYLSWTCFSMKKY